MSEQFCPHCMKSLYGGEEVCPECGGSTGVRAAAYHLPIGTVLSSRSGHRFLFGIVKGEGGFGLTYIGKECDSGKLVAIKEYFPSRCQPQRLHDASVWPEERFGEAYGHGMQSFLSEASMLRAVGDIHSIVHVMDYFEANHTAYMVMEYLDGQTLYQVMQSGETIRPEVLIPKFLPLMYDLAHLHESGVLHRDIAPDNIMWMPDGTLKLLDFGCARSLEDGRSMTVVLKPGFAPIEQYQTRGQGPFTDIYALCATMYYCMTGKVPPASPERLTETFDNHPDPLAAPSVLGVLISEKQEQILMWGLSLQPSVRPQDIAVVASRLEESLVSEQNTPLKKPVISEETARLEEPAVSREVSQLEKSMVFEKTSGEAAGGNHFGQSELSEKKIWVKIAFAAAVVVAAIILIWLL